MASYMDMTMNERIRSIRMNRARGRGRGRGLGRTIHGRVPGGLVSGGRMYVAARRAPVMVKTRPSSHAIAKTIHRTRTIPWQHDLFEDSIRAAGIQGIDVGTKLYVSNLEKGVTNDDIRELFLEIGDMKRYAIHYDRNGRPSGSAEVVYTRRSDAFAALKRYNNVLLDGKPMKIEVAKAELPVTARVNVTDFNGQRQRTVVVTPRGVQTGGSSVTYGSAAARSHHGNARGSSRRRGFVGARGRGSFGSVRGGSGRGHGGFGGARGARGAGHDHAIARGAGRGRGRSGKKLVKSADELDKELDTYHAEAMNIS